MLHAVEEDEREEHDDGGGEDADLARANRIGRFDEAGVVNVLDEEDLRRASQPAQRGLAGKTLALRSAICDWMPRRTRRSLWCMPPCCSPSSSRELEQGIVKLPKLSLPGHLAVFSIPYSLILFPCFSAALNFALLERGLRSISSSPAVTAFWSKCSRCLASRHPGDCLGDAVF